MENLQNRNRRLSLISDAIIFIAISVLCLSGIKLYIKYVSGSALQLNDYTTNSLTSINKEESISFKEENKDLIKKLKQHYHINILYGSETDSYANMVNGNIQNDEYIINNNLKLIYQALEKYPLEVFNNLNNDKRKVDIVILDKFENDNVALATKNNLNNFKIYISNTEKFERAFHHEIFHILEYYMSDHESYLFASWYRLNPVNFQYTKDINKLTKEYVYSQDLQNSSYFVTKYSKYEDKEDRAEIFSEVMMANFEVTYLNQGESIRKKVDAIEEELVANVTNKNFYFYKFLK